MASRYAIAFVFITFLLDTIGLGIVIPVAPGLIAQLTHTPVSGAARWGGWLFFVYALMQFLSAPVIGNLSDRFGRRPVLILSLLVLGVDYAITGLAPTIAWLFAGRALSGMAGASYPTVNAYIADVSPPEKRAANFGIVGAAFGLGFILGPAVGGVGNPALNAILTQDVPATGQGELQGAASSLTSLASVLAMWAMPTLFAWFSGPSAPVSFPGAAFLAAALCELGALALFARRPGKAS